MCFSSPTSANLKAWWVLTIQACTPHRQTWSCFVAWFRLFQPVLKSKGTLRSDLSSNFDPSYRWTGKGRKNRALILQLLMNVSNFPLTQWDQPHVELLMHLWGQSLGWNFILLFWLYNVYKKDLSVLPYLCHLPSVLTHHLTFTFEISGMSSLCFPLLPGWKMWIGVVLMYPQQRDLFSLVL